MSRKISFNGQTFVVPDDATDDEITQIAGGGSAPPAPNAGLAGPAKPAGMGSGRVKEGSSVNKAPLIENAPEESGLETGPLVARNPAENDTLTHGAGSFRALARTASAAADALNPVKQVPAMFHAAFDKPEDSQQDAEEQGAAVGGSLQGAPPILSRFLYRTAIKPAVNAVEDYAAGRVSPEAAGNVAPEALGTAGGTVVGGKALESLGAAALKKLAPSTLGADLVHNTYSKPGDHLAASLRSNTKVDVPAEAKVAAPAIEEGLNDRGISTKDFKGRNGPAALQAGIDNAIDIHEARAKYAIDPIRGEAVDPQVLAKNPELASRFLDKDGNLPKKPLTYGDLDAERIKMNKELRTSNFYSKPPSAQYAVGDPLANLHDAAAQARELVYGKAGETTGVDLRPMKQTESSLIKLGDLAETTKNTLSAKAAQHAVTPLPKKILGTVQGALSVKANPINAFSIPEKSGIFDPTNEFNSHMQRAFPSLKAATADRTMSFPNYNLNLTPSGSMPAPLQRTLHLSGGENVPGEDLKLTPSGDMPPALQRVLGLENPGVPSPLYPGVKK